MAFIIDESFLPATLTTSPMTDLQFAELCSEHPDLFFEMSAEGELIVMAPTYSLTGIRNASLTSQLINWAQQDARGEGTDSSTGFVLPNGARRSADASWVESSKIKQLSQDSLEGFWHLCPDFVIELKSKTDRIKIVRRKMQEWMANGAQLGWLINPEARTVEIYTADGNVELLTNPQSIAAGRPVQGFVLELSKVWDPLGSGL